MKEKNTGVLFKRKLPKEDRARIIINSEFMGAEQKYDQLVGMGFDLEEIVDMILE